MRLFAALLCSLSLSGTTRTVPGTTGAVLRTAGDVLRTTGTASPSTRDSFAWRRAISIGPTAGHTDHEFACAILDASVFAHTDPTLSDLRLYLSGPDLKPGVRPESVFREAPFAITLSRTAVNADSARILNAGSKEALTSAGGRKAGGARNQHQFSFDLQMPARAYSAVNLGFTARNFIASARVTGLRALDDCQPTYLGIFSVFDLTAQHLGRSANLPLAESTFPYLHVEMTIAAAPGSPDTELEVAPAFITSAEVPPSRVAQTLYTTIAETTHVAERPHETVATFNVPAHVPIERVSFELDPADRINFSRPITLSATLTGVTARPSGSAFPVEQLSGEISRVHLLQNSPGQNSPGQNSPGQNSPSQNSPGHNSPGQNSPGHNSLGQNSLGQNSLGQSRQGRGSLQVEQQSLSVPAVVGSNAQSPVTVEVAVENGEDRPLKLRSVRLEMRQRKLCFAVPGDASSPPAAELDYGSPGTPSPVYDFGRVFNAAQPTGSAVLLAETANPNYVPRAIARSFHERFPEVLWLALLSTIMLLGMLAWRSSRSL